MRSKWNNMINTRNIVSHSKIGDSGCEWKHYERVTELSWNYFESILAQYLMKIM